MSLSHDRILTNAPPAIDTSVCQRSSAQPNTAAADYPVAQSAGSNAASAVLAADPVAEFYYEALVRDPVTNLRDALFTCYLHNWPGFNQMLSVVDTAAKAELDASAEDPGRVEKLLDDMQAGLRTALTGESTKTLTESVTTAIAEWAGLSPENAGRVGLGVDFAAGVFNPGKLGKHAIREAVEHIGREGVEHTDDVARAGARLGDEAVDGADEAVDAQKTVKDATGEGAESGAKKLEKRRKTPDEVRGGCPIAIPKDATIIDQTKAAGYDQIKSAGTTATPDTMPAGTPGPRALRPGRVTPGWSSARFMATTRGSRSDWRFWSATGSG